MGHTITAAGTCVVMQGMHNGGMMNLEYVKLASNVAI